ncbi:MAG: hypothetical protein Q9227_008348 [Pyrenula ochraceoflavens]
MHLLAVSTILSICAIFVTVNSTPVSPISQTALLSDDGTAEASIPTRYQSTVLARRLLALSPFGVLSTVFPSPSKLPSDSSESSFLSSPPASVAGTPISLPDYLADCESSGNPTILALSVATSTKNALAGSNVSLSLTWWDQYASYAGRQPWSEASLPRVSLLGYLEEIPLSEARKNGIVECYTEVHPDSRLWLPGDRKAAHQGAWMRLIVQEVYWIGGFGDVAYIGWLDSIEWKAVTKKEWQNVRLPGENIDKQ